MAEESMVIDSGINEEIVVIIYILFHDLLLQIVSECYVHGGLAVEYKTHTKCRIEINTGIYDLRSFRANGISYFYAPKRSKSLFKKLARTSANKGINKRPPAA